MRERLMFRKVLIANRGAIACRMIRTLRPHGRGVGRGLFGGRPPFAACAQANEAVLIGPAPAAQSYLDSTAVLEAARRTGAEAIHPGYGFLSENAAFAEACEARGIVFIGPDAGADARFRAEAHGARDRGGERRAAAAWYGAAGGRGGRARRGGAIGFPVMLKSTAGGGGIGMRLCRFRRGTGRSVCLRGATEPGKFRDGGMYLEKFVAQRAPHRSADLRRWTRRL